MGSGTWWGMGVDQQVGGGGCAVCGHSAGAAGRLLVPRCLLSYLLACLSGSYHLSAGKRAWPNCFGKLLLGAGGRPEGTGKNPRGSDWDRRDLSRMWPADGLGGLRSGAS